MNQAKRQLIYKTMLISTLFLGVILIFISGLALYTHTFSDFFLSLHLFSAIWLLSAIALHLIHRRAKLRKLKTQLMDWINQNPAPSFCTFDRLINQVSQLTFQQLIRQFDLDEQQTKVALHQIPLHIADSHQPLYRVCRYNSEKLFRVVEIIFYLKTTQKDSL